MKIFDKIRAFINKTIRPTAGADEERILDWLGIPRSPKKVLGEVTYFTCLKMLSETLGKMPIKFYQQTERGVEEAQANPAYGLLKTRPNPQMTPTIFWTAVENNRNHYGNAYVWIQREFKRKKYGGDIEIKGLWIMQSESVTVLMDDKGVFGAAGDIYYWYADKYSGESHIFPSGDVMHFKTSMSFDGLTGAPVRNILKATIEGGLESQAFMNNLYKGGLTARAALQYTGDLSPALEKKLIARLEEYANGANNAGKFIPVPIGMKLEPLNIKLTDSQFFELKKYSALQIAGAFGIKPNQINDYEKSSYANSEMQNISFYIDTALYILKQYEEEINYKLLDSVEIAEGKYYKFNENVILRTDAKSQAEILRGYVQNGIYTLNEARSYMNKPGKEGGDDLICNGNYIKVADIGKEGEEDDKNIKVTKERQKQPLQRGRQHRD
ncbi:MAG: phage portal protein [Roseburia sp.]|nr:phage portal protein [Roseburia sp.]